MAKFYGAIGYALSLESVPGVWRDTIVEKKYRGDVLTNQIINQSGEKVNDDISLDNSISIIASAYAYDNIGAMKYVVLDKTPWVITSFTINRPRIVLKIGGVYNGERPSDAPQ